MLDKNGKLFGKISIIDIAILLLVIVFAIGLWIRLGSKTSEFVKSRRDFTYTVKVENVRKYGADALSKKGKITDKKAQEVIGEIVDVQVVPAEFQSVTAQGKVVTTDLPERYNCIVVIKSNGKESSDSYFTSDNTEISAGKEFEIYSKYVKTTGTITSVDVE